jgi:tRNA A-37 threonylcarbamoyl transferase component Bud32
MRNIVYIFAVLIKKTRGTRKKWNVNRDLAYWSSQKSKIIVNKNNAIRIEELGLRENGLKSVKENLERSKHVVIANIDQDGFFLSHFGPIEGVPCVGQENFLPRKRFLIDLVTIDGRVGIKKNYKKDCNKFLCEMEALHCLSSAGCNVPTILDADFKNYSLTMSYIPGKVLREELASRGAILRDRDVDENPQFIPLSPGARKLKRIDEGKKYLRDIVNEDFIEKLFDQVIKIHAAGFKIYDMKYGNIIIEKKTGNPFLIDFESSENLKGMGKPWITALYEGDIERFNLLFGTDKKPYQR